MIRHQAIAKNVEGVFLGHLPDQGQIVQAVLVDEENVLVVVAPLDNVVSGAFNHYAR
jgi:hypothetical protein